MVNKFLAKSKSMLFSEQTTVLSAAGIIMVMIAASQILGLIIKRVILYYFTPSEASLFFAAFRLPDLIFEVFVFGTFSSAFIPIFSKAIKEGKEEAWDIAGRIINIGLVLFIFFAVVMNFSAFGIYKVIAPGYKEAELLQIAAIAKLLFLAQGFFIISYVLTGVLESFRRFLIPALAPLLYNVGIIIGTVLFSHSLGLMAPAVGVLIGALIHFLIQLPLAYKLGFRFSKSFRPNSGVRSIGKLAAPRLADLSFRQIVEGIILYFSSFLGTASYAYFTLANSLQLAPVRLIGTSLSKAALPTLSAEMDKPKEFTQTLLATLYQIFFLIMPAVVIFVVLRIPVVRLAFGTRIFDWQATVETGTMLSAFALGIPFQATVALLARAFYALHDTKTPVTISIVGDTIVIALVLILMKGFSLPSYALALAFSLGSFMETIILIKVLEKRIEGIRFWKVIVPILKTITASVASGLTMYFLIKFFDRSVWIKRLSFVNNVNALKNIPFDNFVLDTRYTANLLFLTIVVASIGLFIYLLVAYLLRSQELLALIKVVNRKIGEVRTTTPESIVPPANDDVS